MSRVSAEVASRTVSPEEIMGKIRPGMNIFIGTGVAEPRTLVKHMMQSQAPNVQDLDLLQLVSLGDAIALQEQHSHTYRLKTFFAGWEANEAISAGLADFIPSRYYQIPGLIESGNIPIDVVFVQITPPNEAGYCSLGVSIDAGRQAMEQASLVVGEINLQTPQTFGDTFVHVNEFDFFVQSTEPMIYFERWPVDEVDDQIGANIASMIEDGSCLGFSIGPLYEAMSRYLMHKSHLGIHTPFFIDAVMDLVQSGAVTNRYKEVYRGKSLTSYAFGTPKLMQWLDGNPLVEFQGTDKVFDPLQISRNPRYVAVLPARKVDLSGRISLHTGQGNVGSGPGEVFDFFYSALLSSQGRTIFALRSRNRRGEPNIHASVRDFPNQFGLWESVNMIATEYGVVSLTGRTVRERAQALIDIAHPDDRPSLVEQAKASRIVYPDQLFLPESAHQYPASIGTTQTFKGGLAVRFRAIKPADEEDMRRLFYRFSDQAVYYRYFTRLQAMPHTRMQEYVNIDYCRVLSIVGLVGGPDKEQIIAEGRFVQDAQEPEAEVALIVDEQYQGLGIATSLYHMLVRLAQDRGVQAFTGAILPSNRAMKRVLDKGGFPVNATMDHGVELLKIPLEGEAQNGERT